MKMRNFIEKGIVGIDDKMILEAAEHQPARSSSPHIYIIDRGNDTLRNLMTVAACIVFAVAFTAGFIFLRGTVTPPTPGDSLTDTTNTPETESETETEENTGPVELSNDEYIYYLENGEITIARYIGKDAEVTVPEKIDGYPVTGLSPYQLYNKYGTQNGVIGAFDGKDVTKITLPDSIVSIAKYSFGKVGSLESVVIGEGVTELPSNILSSCSSLYEVYLPKSIKTVGIAILPSSCKTVHYSGGIYSWKQILHNSKTSKSLLEARIAFVGDALDGEYDGVTVICYDKNETTESVDYYEGNNGEFEYYVKDGGVYITKCLISENIVRVPERIDGYPVVHMEGTDVGGATGGTFAPAFTPARVRVLSLPGTIKKIYGSVFLDCTANVLEIKDGTEVIMLEDMPYLRILMLPSSLKEIGNGVFPSSVKYVYFAGTKEEWEALAGSGNRLGTHRVIEYGDEIKDYDSYYTVICNSEYTLFDAIIDSHKYNPIPEDQLISGLVKLYGETKYPELGTYEYDLIHYETIYLCSSNEVYESGGYDVLTKHYQYRLNFSGSEEKILSLYLSEDTDTSVIIKETDNASQLPPDVHLELLNSSGYVNCVLSKYYEMETGSVSSQIDLLSLPEIKKAYDLYADYEDINYYYYLYSAKRYGNAVSFTLYTHTGSPNYHTFIIDIETQKVIESKEFDNSGEHRDYVTYGFGGNESGENDEPGILYESDRMKIYEIDETDVYIVDKKKNVTITFYDGLTEDEVYAIIEESGEDIESNLGLFEGLRLFDVYDDRYIIYEKIGYEWVCGYGIYDIETGSHHYLGGYSIYERFGNRLYVYDYFYDGVSSDLRYTEITGTGEYVYTKYYQLDSIQMYANGAGEYLLYPKFSPDGKYFTVMTERTGLEVTYTLYVFPLEAGSSITRYDLSRSEGYVFVDDNTIVEMSYGTPVLNIISLP